MTKEEMIKNFWVNVNTHINIVNPDNVNLGNPKWDPNKIPRTYLTPFSGQHHNKLPIQNVKSDYTK